MSQWLLMGSGTFCAIIGPMIITARKSNIAILAGIALIFWGVGTFYVGLWMLLKSCGLPV